MLACLIILNRQLVFSRIVLIRWYEFLFDTGEYINSRKFKETQGRAYFMYKMYEESGVVITHPYSTRIADLLLNNF